MALAICYYPKKERKINYIVALLTFLVENVPYLKI